MKKEQYLLPIKLSQEWIRMSDEIEENGKEGSAVKKLKENEQEFIKEQIKKFEENKIIIPFEKSKIIYLKSTEEAILAQEAAKGLLNLAKQYDKGAVKILTIFQNIVQIEEDINYLNPAAKIITKFDFRVQCEKNILLLVKTIKDIDIYAGEENELLTKDDFLVLKIHLYQLIYVLVARLLLLINIVPNIQKFIGFSPSLKLEGDIFFQFVEAAIAEKNGDAEKIAKETIQLFADLVVENCKNNKYTEETIEVFALENSKKKKLKNTPLKKALQEHYAEAFKRLQGSMQEVRKKKQEDFEFLCGKEKNFPQKKKNKGKPKNKSKLVSFEKNKITNEEKDSKKNMILRIQELIRKIDEITQSTAQELKKESALLNGVTNKNFENESMQNKFEQFVEYFTEKKQCIDQLIQEIVQIKEKNSLNNEFNKKIRGARSNVEEFTKALNNKIEKIKQHAENKKLSKIEKPLKKDELQIEERVTNSKQPDNQNTIQEINTPLLAQNGSSFFAEKNKEEKWERVARELRIEQEHLEMKNEELELQIKILENRVRELTNFQMQSWLQCQQQQIYSNTIYQSPNHDGIFFRDTFYPYPQNEQGTILLTDNTSSQSIEQDNSNSESNAPEINHQTSSKETDSIIESEESETSSQVNQNVVGQEKSSFQANLN